MSEPALILGGEVGSVFTYGKEADYAASVEASRLEQEAICGYTLRVIKTRQTKTVDASGAAVYEVYATFGPVEPVEETPWAEGDTLAPPAHE